MDDLDLSLLLELLMNARQSYSQLARRLNTSPFLARKRVERLRDAGVIGKFAASLNPAFVGQSVCFTLIYVKAGSDQSALVGRISKHPKVVGAVTSLENMLQVVHLYGTPQELSANVDKMKTFAEVEKLENYLLLMPGPTSPQGMINATRRRIIQALKEGCRKSDQQVARELGISTKTVKRNIKYLQDRGVLVFMINPDTSSGDLLAYTLIAKFTKIQPEPITKLRAILRRIFYMWRAANEEALICTVFVDKPREIESHIKQLRELPEIREVITYTPTKMYYFDKWMDSILSPEVKHFIEQEETV